MLKYLLAFGLTVFSSHVFAQADVGWPGQPSNPVGWQSFGCPGGQLTPWTGGDIVQGGVAGNPRVLTCYDFVDSLTIAAPHVKIQGSRFQATGNSGQQLILDDVGGVTDITVYRSSFVPYLSLAPQPKCGVVWPTCGAGLQYAPEDLNSNPNPNLVNILIDNSIGYQSAISDYSKGVVTVDHSEMWGWANAVSLIDGSTGQKTYTDNWIHDSRHPGYQPNDDHGDGIGYLTGGAAPHNVLIQHNTIAAEANTNAIAFQDTSTRYANIHVINNFLSCCDWMFMMGSDSAMVGSNNVVTGNVFSSVIPWSVGPMFGDLSAAFRRANSGNKWQGNLFSVWPNTAPTVDQTIKWQQSWNGWFIVPNWNAPYSQTDFQ